MEEVLPEKVLRYFLLRTRMSHNETAAEAYLAYGASPEKGNKILPFRERSHAKHP